MQQAVAVAVARALQRRLSHWRKTPIRQGGSLGNWRKTLIGQGGILGNWRKTLIGYSALGPGKVIYNILIIREGILLLLLLVPSITLLIIADSIISLFYQGRRHKAREREWR